MSDVDPGDSGPQIDGLLEYIYRARGFDFHGYKRPSLLRRIRKRMQAAGVSDFGAYIDRLEVDPEEFSHLFDTILINVTSFFRDGVMWDQVQALFETRILPHSTPATPARLWSAGCATGEEAYSLAILLAEIMGIERLCRTTKIYATDIDEKALNQARQAVYDPRSVASVPPTLLDRYFDKTHHGYTVNKDLRRCVIFGRHNLIQDAPISRVDLLSCRNTLMYFNAETQMKILSRFHFALKDDGILFLGKAEMLLAHSPFAPLDLKRRIFTKVHRPSSQNRSALPPLGEPSPPSSHGLREASFEGAAMAQLILDAKNRVALCNERARSLFGLQAADVGRPFAELQIAQHGELRATCERASAERVRLSCPDLDWRLDGTVLSFVASCIPMLDAAGGLLGLQICFLDVSLPKRLQGELQQVRHELESTYEELQSTNEELETTNEELQSTVEELETTNEELQSTNEELETMNEELQMTNEQLRQRGDQLNQSNTFLSSVLGGLRVGVVVLDHELLVSVWNHQAEEMWGLRQDEVQGRAFLSLDIGLPVDQLGGALRACAKGGADYQVQVLEATNRRGKAILCKVSCGSLPPLDDPHHSTILLMEEVTGAAS